MRCCRRTPSREGAACSSAARADRVGRRARSLAERSRPAGRLRRAAQHLVGRPRPPLLRRLRAVGLHVRAVHLHAEGSRSRTRSRGARTARPGRACASRFPADVPAHSREQSYWFGPDGLIRRNDYTAEVFGGWAKATHYCWDYREFGGFMIPTRRTAMPRGPAAGRCARSRSCRSRSTTCAQSDGVT